MDQNYQPSFWERETVFSNIDVCIIGSGIVGLNSAINIKLSAPKLNIIVVDAGFLPYGASTRNAGFACFGSMTELIDDLSKESESEVFKRVELRWKGLKKLRSFLGDDNIEYEPLGGYELFTKDDANLFSECRDNIGRFNNLLKEITGIENIYSVATGKIDEFGFNNVQNLILNSGEGQLNTGKMMDSLIYKAQQNNIRIINGLRISELVNTENFVEIRCGNQFTFRAKKCVVANNGFASTLLHELDVKPARAQVLITKPVRGLKVKGSFHYDKGFYYFRNVGDRILFGGGRNLNFEGETTTTFGTTAQIQNRLDELLKNVILPDQSYEIDMRWSGIMGLGNSKSTILRKIESNIFCAVRMGGMGVAIGSVIGEEAAKMVIESM